MFVRWQKRKRKSRAFGGRRGVDTHWAAILAENVRVAGEPTQRHVAYLGGITDSGIEADAQRAFFCRKPQNSSTGSPTEFYKRRPRTHRGYDRKRECVGSHERNTMNVSPGGSRSGWRNIHSRAS